MLKLQLFEEPGHYVKLTTLPVTIGRDESNDLTLEDTRVSDFHAEINGDSEDLYIVDLLSASGTLVNEHRVVDRAKLKAWDIIRVGTVDLEINDPNTCRPDSWVLRTESDLLSSQFYTLHSKTVVGRDADCDLTIDWHLLSRKHAELLIEDGHLRVVDLDSRNGTYLNGEQIEDALAYPGDELRFDEQRFIIVGPSRSAVDDDRDEDRTQLRGADADRTLFAVPQQSADSEEPPVPVDPDETRLMMASAKDDETRLILGNKPVASQRLQQAFVTINSGGQKGMRRLIDSPRLTIGRNAENDIVLDETGVSKQHAEIVFTAGSWSIKDRGSSNGVLVNKVAAKQTRLKTGDQIMLGRAELLFECDATDSGLSAEAETQLYQTPESQDHLAAKGNKAPIQVKPGGRAVTKDHNSRTWLPGLLVFLATVSLAVAVYIWRTGNF